MQEIDSTTTPILPASIPVAIYARVSTYSQVGGRFDSCESQVAICRDYVARHAAMGWFELATFVDAAYSSGDMNRPGFQALKRQVECGGIKVVLIYKLERLLRSIDDWSSFRTFLKKHGCTLISATEDLSDRVPSDRLRTNLLVAVAEYERLNTAEKVRIKLYEQAKRGIWNCGLVPFGYDYDRQAKLLFPNATEASVVVRIFEQTARLMPIRKIARALTANGVKTRERIFRQRDGGVRRVGARPFRSDTLRDLIANPIYAGRIRFNREEFPGNHLPIVGGSLWERANAAMARPASQGRRVLRARNKHAHLLKDIVQCQTCGRIMVPLMAGRRPNGEPYRYYVCDYSRNPKDGTRCVTGNVPASFLETAILRIIDHCAKHAEIMNTAVRLSQLRSNADVAAWRQQLEATSNSLTGIEQRIKNCAHAIQLDGYAVLRDELRAELNSVVVEKQNRLVERERLSQLLRAADFELADLVRLRSELENFSKAFLTATPEQRHDLAHGRIEKIELTPVPQRSGKSTGGSFKLTIKLRASLSAMKLPAGSPSLEPTPVAQKQKKPVEMIVVVSALGRSSEIFTFFPGESEIVLSRSNASQGRSIDRSLHPLHRALKWEMRLKTEPALNRIALAREESVCPATITHHLKLLQLAPEIQTKLLSVTTPSDLDKFSLNKMKALAGFPIQEQLLRFGEN